VGELPEDDIVEYVGITIRDPLGTAKDGEFFEYTLTFQEDRCYPSYTWWKADKRDVAVFLVERSTREVRSVDTFLQKTGINCLENCSDPIIPYACRPAGTHTHFARIPAHAGVWDLSIGQVALPGETCVGRCVTIPPRNDGEPGQRYRILDQAPTVEPVDVKTIYATQHRDGSKALDLAQVLDRPFYLWVEFVEDNPFPVEIVDVMLVNEQADAEPVTVRRYQSNYRLYRSEQLTGRSFRPKQDAESGR
jgi:hypothetical protein